VNCITLAGYGLRYFPCAELLCRVALQAFRRVDQRGRRCLSTRAAAQRSGDLFPAL